MRDPEDVVLRNFAAFNAKDAQGVIDTYTEDCILIDITAPEPTYGSAFLHEHMANLSNAFPDMHIEDERWVTGENLVAAEFVLVGTHLGEFLGYPPSGNVIRWVTCSFFDLTDDNERIWKETYYYDMASVTAQLQPRED